MGTGSANRKSETTHASEEGAPSALLLLVAFAALGWIAAFYALWIDAEHRSEAASVIARLEAENALLIEAMSPFPELAAAPAPNRREPATTSGVIRLADARDAAGLRFAEASREQDDAEAERRLAREQAARVLEDRVLALRDDIVRLERQESEGRGALAAAQQARDALALEVRAVLAVRDSLVSEAETLEARARDTRAALTRTLDGVTDAESALSDARTRVARVERELAELQASRDAAQAGARARLDALNAEIVAREEGLAAARASEGAFAMSVEESLAAQAAAAQAVADADARRDAAEAAARVAETAAVSARTRLDTLRSEVGVAERRLAERRAGLAGQPAPSPAAAPGAAPIETRADGARIIRVVPSFR